MKKVILGLLALSSISAFADDNCVLKGKPDFADGIVPGLISHRYDLTVANKEECVNKAKTLLGSTFIRKNDDGLIKYPDTVGTYRKVKYKFLDHNGTIVGEVSNKP